MKKDKQSALNTNFDPSVFETAAPELPNKDTVLKSIVEITPAKAPPAKLGRVKLTTAIEPNLLQWLKIHAIKSNLSPADIIDAALREYKERLPY